MFFLILLVGVLLRVSWAFARSPELGWDEPLFTDLAKNLVGGRGFSFSHNVYRVAFAGRPTSFEEPLYPMWLALVQLVSGTTNTVAIRVIQAAISSLIVVLVYILGSLVFSRSAGLLSAFVTAMWPSLIYFSAFLMSDALFLLLLPLALLSLLSTISLQRERRFTSSIGWLLAVGIVWGMVVLTRGLALGLLLVSLVWLAIRSKTRSGLAQAAIIAVGVVVILIP